MLAGATYRRGAAFRRGPGGGALGGICWPHLGHTPRSPPPPGPDSSPRTLRWEDGDGNPNTWCREWARPRSANPSGSILTASHAQRSTTERRRCRLHRSSRQRRPDRPLPTPRASASRRKTTPGPESCGASPPPGSSGARARARRAHAPSGSHPDTYTNRAPGTRAHTHRGHAGTAAPLPHKGWCARGYTQPRAGTLAVPSPRRVPAATHLHPRAPGAPWGPLPPGSSPRGVRCGPLRTPLRRRCGDQRPQNPLPLRGPDRPRFPSSPSWPAHLAQVRRPSGPGPANTHLSGAALSWALRVSPAAPRTRTPRPAHLPESGRGGNG